MYIQLTGIGGPSGTSPLLVVVLIVVITSSGAPDTERIRGVEGGKGIPDNNLASIKLDHLFVLNCNSNSVIFCTSSVLKSNTN